MNRKVLLAISLFTVFVCCIFVAYNPTIADDNTSNFTDGETFTPINGHFDFRDFSLNSSRTKNFTTKIISNGHTQFIDDTGNITVNYLELDMMVHIKRDKICSFLNGELEKPSWSVDGVVVHQIDFREGPLYSAYYKDSSADVIVYLSTQDEEQTAELMNSLNFTR